MFHIFFFKHSTDRKYYNYGSSKEILVHFFRFLDERMENISEINLCLYLYNNEILHNKMKELANRGIVVNVISIPLEGYDARYPKDILDFRSNAIIHKNATKYSLAKEIYDDIVKFDNKNYKLHLFGHTYVRSSRMRSFARGTLPYSLHTKSIFIKLKDGGSISGLTSSNLAVRDESKDELMILIEDTNSSRKSSELFFSNLIKNSTAADKWLNPYPKFHYDMEIIDAGAPGNNYYAAPFFVDSPVKISNFISDLLGTAKHRIYICAEHLAAYNYYDMNSIIQPGLFGTIFKKSKEGIPVSCLSQTYVDANGYSHGQRSPSNTKMFSQLIQEIDRLGNISYAVNKNVHAKFIVIDDTVVISTANYTPTEFIYGDVFIDKFDADSLNGITYKGVFSEVSHFITIESKSLADELIKFFRETVNQPDTFIHRGPDTGSQNDNKRIYINCPYREKDEAKKLGAKWDPSVGKWYYTAEGDAYLFKKWE